MSNINTEGKPFVVLRGLEYGNVFWTMTRQGEDVTKTADGTVAYEVVKYCDTAPEAVACWKEHYSGVTF